MAAIRTAFKLLDEQLRKARPGQQRVDDYHYQGSRIDGRMVGDPGIVKAKVAYEAACKAFKKANAKLTAACKKAAARHNKRYEAEYKKKLKAWEKMEDEVEHLKITLSLGVDASEQVLALLSKLKAL